MTAAAPDNAQLLALVDATYFRDLFVEELGWDNPDQPPRTITFEDSPYTLRQVAGYKGMRIWHCPELPGRRIQRGIDALLAHDNLERLVIFSNAHLQEWRWPRRAQTGGANAKLLVHRHTAGDSDSHLAMQLSSIAIDFDDQPTLVELLTRMRAAFDTEAEAASVGAARIMGRLYTDLANNDVSERDATLLLARLLFLLFGDDSGMWDENLFAKFLAEHTTEETLHKDLEALFDVLNRPERKRVMPAESPYSRFRYVNGGLYGDTLSVPPLGPDFREALLDACEFNWALISPAVFGSMFQTVKDRDARRAGGEHYTTEENILKTIRPLFLDEYWARLDSAWDDKGQLTKLHNELGRLRIMDPACGCGNFLIVAYRELRSLELEILKRRRDLDDADGIRSGRNLSQMTLDVTGDIKVTLDHFYGLEIDEWPARIAETAMLLVDHLANQNMAEEFGVAPDRLPITLAPTIVHGNAMRLDWKAVLAPSDDVIILGNPPFIGHEGRSAEQADELRTVWNRPDIGRLDYVTGWYAKALDYFGDHSGRWAFVSTNSICQGEPVPALFGPVFTKGWRIRFAHRTFKWTSEAPGAAVVHCIIVGFDRDQRAKGHLFSYPDPAGPAHEHWVSTINAYLVDAPNVLIDQRRTPLSPGLPRVIFGNMPRDDGYLIVEPKDYERVISDPVASKYVREFVGARQLIHNQKRWCLWLPDLEPEDVDRSPILKGRLDAVADFRLKSTAESTRAMAATPHLFGQRSQPTVDYICIPRHVGENRKFFTVSHFSPEVIVGDSNFEAPDPDGYLFALLSSSMFLVWLRTIGGRLESRLRFSNTVVWNNFPLPAVTADERAAIIQAGVGVLQARDIHPERSLAQHYDPTMMDTALVAAHEDLDQLVDKAFGAREAHLGEEGRQELLFARYSELNSRP